MKLFGPKSFDKIVGSLTKITSELHDHADHHDKQNDQKYDESLRLRAEALVHRESAAKARAAASRIAEMIGGQPA